MSEKTVLLAKLAERRHFLLQTAQGLSDEQARARTTVSELTIGGIIRHVSSTEKGWVQFIVHGKEAMGDVDWSSIDWENLPDPMPDWLREHQEEFILPERMTLSQAVEEYQAVAAETERIVNGLQSLEVRHELPAAPWFEQGASHDARDVLLQLIAETAQHSGHADIIRESIDGAKTMG